MLAGDPSILTNDRSSGQSGHIQKTIGAPRIIMDLRRVSLFAETGCSRSSRCSGQDEQPREPPKVTTVFSCGHCFLQIATHPSSYLCADESI
jgi:hypothetical protein